MLLAGGGARATRVYQFAENCAARLQILLEAKQGQGDRLRVRSGEANHTDSTPSGRSGNGDDGVVEVHGKIVAGERGLRRLAGRYGIVLRTGLPAGL